MQAPTVANDFLTLVEKSGLLSANQIRKATDRFNFDESMKAESVARTLVRERVLTPFQAERLLEGRYRGFLIDGYRVREILGIGGMGCVYIAEDAKKTKKVALKILSSQHALDAGMLARMKLEAHAGMLIDHPNVVRTLGIGSTGAANYMVMELFRGITMHELVALSGPVKWQMACDMFMQAAEGLQAAHDIDIIHRDIKPANVLIDSEGTTKLLDFGLALLKKDAAEEFSLAMIFGHDCLGTPDYIAPEQIVDSNEVDIRADIYSLGCTFYVALTGRAPFPEKSNSAKLKAHQTKTAVPIRELRPKVPKEVAAIVERMMSRDPDKRPSTAREVIELLKPHAQRRPVKFQFRELITLRAKQARKKENAVTKGAVSGPRSSITSQSWMGNPSHHLAAEVDTFTADDTPAIRQPAPPRTPKEPVETPRRPSRPVAEPRGNVPKGWSLVRLTNNQRIALTRVKTRIGKSGECEVPMHGTCVDDRQCYVEFADNQWKLHQESKAQPTFVNGESQFHVTLKHGATITFSDGSGFRLVNADQEARSVVRRRKLVLFGAFLAVAALAAAGWFFFLQ